jgi:hypothetical protein
MIPIDPESDPILSLAIAERKSHEQSLLTLERLRNERTRVGAMRSLQDAPGWRHMVELLQQQEARAVEQAIAEDATPFHAGIAHGIRAMIRCLTSPDDAVKALDRSIASLEKSLGKAALAATSGDQT